MKYKDVSLVVKFSNQPKNGDIIIYDDNTYKHISLKEVLSIPNENIKGLKELLLDAIKIIQQQDLRIKKLEEDIKILKGEE